MIGDVCGKGPDAAAVTALARYTLRAAAMREQRPEPEPQRAQRGAAPAARRPPLLHGRLRLPREARPRRPRRASPPAATRCRSCCAPTAAWSRWASPGTLLGIVPDPNLEDRTVTLEPGDSLVFYTDGVIESRVNSNGVLDERRLAELVATCAGRGPDAHRSPDRGRRRDVPERASEGRHRRSGASRDRINV